MDENKKTWLLVDGHNMAFRCFYAVPEMTTTDGLPINAIHGWVRSLWKLEDLVCPNAVCVFFDSGGSAERKELLSSYKANRKAMPDNLRKQMEYMNLLSIAHGYYVITKNGVEADDILAAFAKKLSALGEVSYIASGDKDFAQCVDENVFQLLPPAADTKGVWRLLDKDGVKEKFGVAPSQIIDYLSLLGDSSDNISGVDGIGKKTAEKLLNQFGSINKMLADLPSIASEKIREKLANSREIIDRNQKLISLNGVHEYNIPEAKINRSSDDIFKLLDELQLRSLVSVARKRFSQQQELF